MGKSNLASEILDPSCYDGCFLIAGIAHRRWIGRIAVAQVQVMGSLGQDDDEDLVVGSLKHTATAPGIQKTVAEDDVGRSLQVSAAIAQNDVVWLGVWRIVESR